MCDQFGREIMGYGRVDVGSALLVEAEEGCGGAERPRRKYIMVQRTQLSWSEVQRLSEIRDSSLAAV